MKHTKYEYAILSFHWDVPEVHIVLTIADKVKTWKINLTVDPPLTVILNDLGAEGWELVLESLKGNQSIMTFKRPVIE